MLFHQGHWSLLKEQEMLRLKDLEERLSSSVRGEIFVKTRVYSYFLCVPAKALCGGQVCGEVFSSETYIRQLADWE